jgi:hypothetical protein
MGSAIGGLAVIGGGGAAFVVTDHYNGWIRDILQRGLPGYRLEPEGLARFVDEYFARQSKATKLRIFAAAQGFLNVKAALPDDMAEDFEVAERSILSDFLIGSDFFENYPDGPKEVTYHGMPIACISPFARF